MRGSNLIVAAGLVVAAGVIAGPLNPPVGTIAPTYKTLSEIDPGTPLSSVPAGQGAQHLITQTGGYSRQGKVEGLSGRLGLLSPKSRGVGSGWSGRRPGLMNTPSITGISRRQIRLSRTLCACTSPGSAIMA